MWDFSIQTDHVIKTQRLDDEKRRTSKKKIEKYQDVRRRELQKIWNVRVNIISLIVGS